MRNFTWVARVGNKKREGEKKNYKIMNEGMEVDRQRARYLRGACVEGTNDALATKPWHQLVSKYY